MASSAAAAAMEKLSLDGDVKKADGSETPSQPTPSSSGTTPLSQPTTETSNGSGSASGSGSFSQNLIEQIEYKSPRPTPAGSVQGGGSGLPSSAGSGSGKASSNDSKYWRDKLSMLTSFILFASRGDIEEMQVLVEQGADVNCSDYDGRSALHLAACEGKAEAVEWLLTKGARVNPRDRWGHTPLTDARKAMRGGRPGSYRPIIELLERAGGVDGGGEAEDWEIDPSELDFAKAKLIGKGAFGEIRRVMWRGTPVAVKSILPDLHDDLQITKEFREEMFLLPKLRHPNIVQFLGCCTRKPPLCLVTEYLPGGDLHDVLKHKGPLPPHIAVGYALDIARGMNYLHNRKPESIIHRDLKPRNLLRDESNHLKVADFGLSKLVKVDILREMYKMTGETGSYRYMAPEVFRHEAYDRSVDVYSFAVIVHEMFEGIPPFAKTMTAEGVAWKVAMEGVRPPFKSKNYPEGMKELITRCWATDPRKRPSFMDAIEALEFIEKQVLRGSHHTGSPTTGTQYL